MTISKEDLEKKAIPIVDGLEKGFFMDNYPDEHLRLALAYKMWADGQDSELDDILNPEDPYWTRECIVRFLANTFDYKKLPFKLPNIGA